MIKLENTQVAGWEAAIRGMRNPMNSWAKSDSGDCRKLSCCDCSFLDEMEGCEAGPFTYFIIGNNDHELMMKLAAGGPVHAKYRRMIVVYVDILAPLYWWKEFDTYKIGTVANSCSTMHKIADKEFTLDDFSHEHLIDCGEASLGCSIPLNVLYTVICCLNEYRRKYIETKDKKYWWQMIQLLPLSYNQRRTVMLNYEVLAGIYHTRKNHKLDEWRDFCKWIEELPYSEVICGDREKEES